LGAAQEAAFFFGPTFYRRDPSPQLEFFRRLQQGARRTGGSRVAQGRSEHVDLDLFAHLFKVFADTPWLHYGLWTEGEVPSFPTLRRAQERYVDKLIGLLPVAPARVLDIGGGTGALAGRLADLGYEVDMLTPSAAQIEIARRSLGARVRLHQTRFEDFVPGGRFDVCLFSESFQYIRLRHVFPKLDSLLAPGGRVVISDCFRSDGFRGGRMIGGGHSYSGFLRTGDSSGYRVMSDEDVTAQVAPSIALDAMLYRDALAPVIGQMDATLKRRSRLAHGLVRGLYHIVVRKADREQLAERLRAEFRTPELFRANNTYRFISLERV
jgi:2-polyprenyl-3-methyl-5-hydroxy-6-metoxy-1,4-benzoquinol methylase